MRPQAAESTNQGGDRVPTRERGQYRSAHQNFRRRMPIAEANELAPVNITN